MKSIERDLMTVTQALGATLKDFNEDKKGMSDMDLEEVVQKIESLTSFMITLKGRVVVELEDRLQSK